MILEDVVKAGNVKACKQLLRHSSAAVFDEIDKNGRNALMLACFSGKLELIQLLINNGAGTANKDNWGKSALMYAVQRGHLEVVKVLIAAHAHVLDQDDSGKTVVDYALACRNKEILAIVNEAIEKGHGSRKGGFSLKSPYFDFGLEDDDEEAEETMWPAIKGAEPSPAKPPDASPKPADSEKQGLAGDCSQGGGVGTEAVSLPPASPSKEPQTVSRPSTKALSRSNSRAPSSKGQAQAMSSRALSRSQTGRMSSISRMNTADSLNGGSMVDSAAAMGLVCHESEFTVLKDPLEYARRGMIEELRAILPQAGGLTQDGLNVKNELGRTPLIVACLHGQVEAMQVLIEAGADIEGLDNNGKTCLFYAIAKRNFEAAKILIESGASFRQVDLNGRTPLMHACMDRSTLPIALELIKAGADLSSTDNKGRTALMYATAIGALDTIQQLLDAGADPYCRDLKDRRADTYGRSLVNYPEILELYRSFKRKSNSLKKMGSQESFAQSTVGSISRLGRSPVPLTPFNPKANVSTLQLVRTGDYKALRTLLDGVSVVAVNERDDRGRTAIMVACLEGKLEPLEMLIEAGADLSIKDNQGKTVLFHSVATGDVTLMKRLIKAGADFKTFDSNGRDPLLQSCVYGNVPAMQELIAAGADVNACDQWGKTPLMYAIGSGMLEAMQMLIAAGADIDAVSNNGKRVKDYAYKCNNCEAIRRILKEERKKKKLSQKSPTFGSASTPAIV